MEVVGAAGGCAWGNSKNSCLSQRWMKNVRSSCAGKEWGNVIDCYRRMPFKMLRAFEDERLTGIHSLKKQIGHESLFRPALLLLFRIDDLFGEVTFALTDDDRIVAVHAKVGHDVLPPQLIIQIHQRDNPRFDEHKKRKAKGNPLFSGSFQVMKCRFKHQINASQS